MYNICTTYPTFWPNYCLPHQCSISRHSASVAELFMRPVRCHGWFFSDTSGKIGLLAHNFKPTPSTTYNPTVHKVKPSICYFIVIIKQERVL